MPRSIQVEEGSGNVFADIGLPNPEEALAKAEIARQVDRVLTKRRLNQVQAGALLRIAQPRVSDLYRPAQSGRGIGKGGNRPPGEPSPYEAPTEPSASGGTSAHRATARVRSGPRPPGKVLHGKVAAICQACGNRCRDPDEDIRS